MDITLDGIAKAFGTSPALHGVDLTIRAGELIGLLGPSGSGKTTLLRIIAGLERPTAGRVLFGEEDALAKPVQERRVGFVFQHYALFRHMSVADNIAYGLRVRPRRTRPASAEIARRVAELLELVQLKDYGARYPAQLSGGQRQRVALARALAVEPRVLLLDEPFGALDAKVRKDLRAWLREIHTRTGHTTVFVTHDQDEALELSDRVAVLDHGRLVQLGGADEVHDRPATPFVFGFIGESSRLPVTLVGGQVRLDGQLLGLAAPGLPDGPGQLFLRPGDVELAATGLPATLRASRRVGALRRATLALGGHGIEADLPAGPVPAPGTALRVRLVGGSVFAGTGAVHYLRGAPAALAVPEAVAPLAVGA